MGPGSKLDLAVLFVEGEPSVVHLAGGCEQVGWDPGDRAGTCHNQLETGMNIYEEKSFFDIPRYYPPSRGGSSSPGCRSRSQEAKHPSGSVERLRCHLRGFRSKLGVDPSTRNSTFWGIFLREIH